MNAELIRKVQEGDSDALNMIIEKNLPLVNAISKKFLNRGYEYDDIFQIGSLGLVKAVQNFNSDFNVKFSTYAVPMIMGEIKRFLRDDGMIKVSRNLKTIGKKIHFCREELVKELKRDPTIEEIAERCDIEVDEVIMATESMNNINYLYDVIHHDDGSPVLLIDKLSESGSEDEGLTDKIALKEALRNLDEKSRQIIVLRYFKDRTQSEVAKLLGISQVQVSRIEKRVLKIMRDDFKEEVCKEKNKKKK